MHNNKKQNLLFFFVDGLGLDNDNENNLIKDANILTNIHPNIFYLPNSDKASVLSGNNWAMIPIDATLGVEGLPQSATGQSALLTGINTAKLLGYHLNAYPNDKIVDIINERSLLLTLKNMGLKITGANAYSKDYFEFVRKTKHIKFTCSTRSIMAADIPFHLEDDLRKGLAVYQDLTNKGFRDFGYDVSLITPEQSALNLVNISKNHDFTFFEYFQTDKAGHSCDKEYCRLVLGNLAKCFKVLSENMDFNYQTLIITSDHGNCENLSMKSHTKNLVPLVIFTNNNKLKEHFINKAKSLLDVYDLIIGSYDYF